MVRRHNKREYSHHRKDKIRPIDEYYKVEIISFVPELTKAYLVRDNTMKVTDGVKKSYKSWTTYRAADKKTTFTLNFDYFAEIDGEYRVDIVYEAFNDKNLTGKFNGKTIRFESAVNHTKRKVQFLNLSAGNNTFTIEFPNNVYFYGAIVRKTLEFVGDSLDSAGTNLLLKTVDCTSSSEIAPAEASFVIGYDNSFENLLNPTGLYMDYNDEVNIYMKKNEDTKETRVFGGYLSSILPDDNKTTLSVSCADRMVDGQNKYILTQLKLLGGTTTPAENEYSSKMDKNFKSYGQAIKHLCKCYEVSIKNNIGKNYLVTGETAYNEL